MRKSTGRNDEVFGSVFESEGQRCGVPSDCTLYVISIIQQKQKPQKCMRSPKEMVSPNDQSHEKKLTKTPQNTTSEMLLEERELITEREVNSKQ